MGLKEVLSKMKIVEIEPDEMAGLRMSPASPSASSASSAVPMPTMTPIPGGPPPGQPTDIRDLLGSLQPPPEVDEQALAAAAGPPEGEEDGDGGIPDFAAIYKAAKIQDPAHGYTAHKVLEILSSAGFANLDSKAKAAALAGFLQMNPTGPVPITDVVQDAVRRDQALDKFEDFLRTKLKARTEQMEKENARLQAEIDEIVRRNREQMDANRRDLEKEEARLAQWQLNKKTEERRLFDAVSPFVEANPITTGEAASASPSPGPAPAPPAGDQG
jgi:hypothetical protein